MICGQTFGNKKFRNELAISAIRSGLLYLHSRPWTSMFAPCEWWYSN